MDKTKTHLNRRTFVKAGAAVVGTVGLTSNSALAAVGTVTKATPVQHKIYKSMTLTQHLCTVMHSHFSDKLSKTLSDDSISQAEKSLAIRTTRCPCCDISISAQGPAQSFSATQVVAA